MITNEELLRRLNKIAEKDDLVINNNQYTLSQIKLAEKILLDLEFDIQLSQRKPKLSRRRAFIVILEELYYDVKEYPKDLTLDEIHKRASVRFEYLNRDSRSLDTPSEIHPKNPCLYYEDNGHGKARYRTALELLANQSSKFFEKPEAEISIKAILEEILLC